MTQQYELFDVMVSFSKSQEGMNEKMFFLNYILLRPPNYQNQNLHNVYCIGSADRISAEDDI
jgi:hypothetical protein